MFSKLKGFFSTDIGIDLGTANSLVYMKDRGIVMREPSVVAIEADSKHVLAVGMEAKKMLGVTPANIVAIRPMKSGVIADFDITEAMLSYFIRKACPNRLWSKYFKPRVVIAVPSGITDVRRGPVYIEGDELYHFVSAVSNAANALSALSSERIAYITYRPQTLTLAFSSFGCSSGIYSGIHVSRLSWR